LASRRENCAGLAILQRKSPLTTGLLALAGLALAWQVTAHSLVAYLANVEPRWALMISPGNADALSRMADAELSAAVSETEASAAGGPNVAPGALEMARAIRAKGIPAPMLPPDVAAAVRREVREDAITAFLGNPLDARAPRILGQIAESEDQTRTLMQSSIARSMHETLSVYWLMQDSYLRGDLAGFASYADILLRSQLRMMSWVAPVLMRLAGTSEGDAPLKTLLRRDPPWRPYFFAALPGAISDARAPLDLMLDLQQNGAAPTTEELRPYLQFLVDRKLYDLAYYTWLQFLPSEQLERTGLLFNGNFEFPSNKLPFDWVFQFGSGVRISVGAPNANPNVHAVNYEFTAGLVGANAVRQLVVLKPGNYSLSGRQLGSINARRGLRWRVACVDHPADLLAQSEAFVGKSLRWKDFSFSFTVPEHNCPAQLVWLELDAVVNADRVASGSAWFTNLALSQP